MICKDCKVILGESVITRHRLVVIDMCLKMLNCNKGVITCTRIRWSRLKGENLKSFMDSGLVNEEGGTLMEHQYDVDLYGEKSKSFIDCLG